jgi:hypothetical protein
VGNVSVRAAIGISALLLSPLMPLFNRAHRQGKVTEEVVPVEAIA